MKEMAGNQQSGRGIHSACFSENGAALSRWDETPDEPPQRGQSSHSGSRGNHAFTLIELLVVIAIIGILASLAFVAIAKIHEKGRITQARNEIRLLYNAIEEYHSDTGSFPVSDQVLSLAIATRGDFTLGGSSLQGIPGIPPMFLTNNSEIMAILLDRVRFPNGAPTVNANHSRNKRQKIYLSDVVYADATNLPGVGSDLVYRDPWGNPYIISIDLNFDDNCRDALYAFSKVSQEKARTGFDNLLNSSDPNGATDDFQYRGGVMIWSLGPDKTAGAQKANVTPNRDNILSWK